MAPVFVVAAVAALAPVAVVVPLAVVAAVALMRLMAIVILRQCGWPCVDDLVWMTCKFYHGDFIAVDWIVPLYTASAFLYETGVCQQSYYYRGEGIDYP